MLDYKDIIIKHYALKMSGREIARQIGASKSGVNEFLRAFEKCDKLQYPLPQASQTMVSQSLFTEAFLAIQEEMKILSFLIMPK